MGLPAITYNGKTIFLPYLVYQLQDDPIGSVTGSTSIDGTVETLNIFASDQIRLAWRTFENASSSDATLKRNLRQWFQWARIGNLWTLALDSSETVLTTLASPASAGDTSLVLTSAAGVVAGKQYIVRSKSALDIVSILSISGAPTVTLAESINFDFAAGHRFRSEQYWPGRLPLNAPNPVIEMPPLHFDFNLASFLEDVNGL